MISQTISIIIISYNNLALTKTCLQSIFKNTHFHNYEIILVDNASDQATRDYLETLEKNDDRVNVVFNQKNLGFAKANNQGARFAAGEYFVFLNNDTIVSNGWLSRLHAHLKNIPDAGMVGPVTNAIGNEAKVPVNYTEPTIEAINQFATYRAEKYAGQFFQIKNLALYCCMISRLLFEQVGGLDERYHIGMFEDDDLAMKIKLRGLKLYCVEDVFIHHFHGASFNQLSKLKRMVLFQINKFKYERKWHTKWIPHQTRQNDQYEY